MATPARRRGAVLHGIVLLAIGRAGDRMVSASVTLAVERPDLPSRLSLQSPPDFVFESPAESAWPIVLAHFDDGVILDVRASTHLSYESTNAGVATVSARGQIRPAGPGQATLRVRYGPASAGLTTTILVSVAPGRTAHASRHDRAGPTDPFRGRRNCWPPSGRRPSAGRGKACKFMEPDTLAVVVRTGWLGTRLAPSGSRGLLLNEARSLDAPRSRTS